MNEEQLIKIESLKIYSWLAPPAAAVSVMKLSIKDFAASCWRVNALLKSFLVLFMTCRSLAEFWGVIKMKSPDYAGRREFLRQEFDPLLTMLESESRTPSDASVSATVVRIKFGLHPRNLAKAFGTQSVRP